MIHRQHLISELRARRDDFMRFDQEWGDSVRSEAERLCAIGQKTSAEIERVVGAPRERITFPSAELDQMAAAVVPFDQRWRTHEGARRWALEVLRDRTTFAADGSQLLPDSEISMPVAAVQVACFENPHTIKGIYRKEARFSVITPKELLQPEDQAGPEALVSFRRFELETAALCDFLESQRGWRARGQKTPVAFFDGTLLISYARQRTEIRFFDDYVRLSARLIALSRETEVPMVGYIDQSYARDIVQMLGALAASGAPNRALCDTQLLRAFKNDQPLLLARWGDRTIFYHCGRKGLTDDFFDERGRPLVGFTYLQTTGEGPPARLDIPAWVYEAHLLDDVIDTVRAECVVGNGYPYAIETADAAAVITGSDREQFLRVIQEFAERERFAFRVSRKAASKVRRR